MSMLGKSLILHADRKVIKFARQSQIPLLRLGLAVVYLWFGTLKLFPGGSPVESLVIRTVSVLTFDVMTGTAARLMAAGTELLIGLVLVSMALPRLTSFLLLAHVVLTSVPLVFFPDEMWRSFMLPTSQGQYIIKNTITVGAAAVIAATALLRSRAGRLEADSLPRQRDHQDVASPDRAAT